MRREKIKTVIKEIEAERRRQINDEGWTTENDDGHDGGEMAKAASCYALQAAGDPRGYVIDEPPDIWPWSKRWWKPKSPRRDLVRAAALIVAEIERLDRETE